MLMHVIFCVFDVLYLFCSSLPELLQKKRFLDMHTTIATALLDCIKARKLDVYFETEEKLMSQSALVRNHKQVTHSL